MDKTRNSVCVLCLVALLAFFWIGCESQLISTDWEGEYEMLTQVIKVYQDNTKDTIRTDLQTPVSIYKNKGKWYVATHYFGVPNADCEEPITLIKLPQRIQCKLDSVENIIVDHPSGVIMSNGLIYTYRNGVKYGSKPIEVQKVTEMSLLFQHSDIFEVPIIGITGEQIDILQQHFEYQPIYKQGDILQWNIELVLDNWEDLSDWKYNADLMKSIKYQNILRKK
jgi:hypothetical protein